MKESISHSARLHDAGTYFPGRTKSPCKILPAKSRLEWLAGDYWDIKNRTLYARGGKGSEKDDSLAIPHGRPRGCDKRVAWFNNAVRSSEAPVRRAGADNHYHTTPPVFLYLCKGVPCTYRSQWAHRILQWFPNYPETDKGDKEKYILKIYLEPPKELKINFKRYNLNRFYKCRNYWIALLYSSKSVDMSEMYHGNCWELISLSCTLS